MNTNSIQIPNWLVPIIASLVTYIDVWKPNVFCSVRVKEDVLVSGGVRFRWKEMGYLSTQLMSVIDYVIRYTLELDLIKKKNTSVLFMGFGYFLVGQHR